MFQSGQTDKETCLGYGGIWSHVTRLHFDNVYDAMITLFVVSTLEGWVDIMWATMDAGKVIYFSSNLCFQQNSSIFIFNCYALLFMPAS